MRLLLLLLTFVFFLPTASAQISSTRTFIFGHSLLDHRPPAIPTPSNETTVPHWVYLLAKDAGYDYAAGGQYGFLPQHERLPPIAQWGYDSVPGVWESDTEPFSAADINEVIITAGNFMQWQGPDQDYPGDPGVTPISATENILDWVGAQEEGVRFYIYENWPDMAGYLNNGFPPTSGEFTNYNDYTTGEFHDWWIIYQDALLASRPAVNVRMVPVGPILARLLSGELPVEIPLTELYEDDAPHGRATLYFLAGLITYQATFAEQASANYEVPDIVHPVIRENYTNIVSFIWEELLAFNDDAGTSRVFFDRPNSIGDSPATVSLFSVAPNPGTGRFRLTGPEGHYMFSLVDGVGREIQLKKSTGSEHYVDLGRFPPGFYSLLVQDQRSGRRETIRLVVE